MLKLCLLLIASKNFLTVFVSNAVKKIKCLINRKFGRKDNSPRISSLCSCFITFVKWGENTGTFKNK